MMWFEVESDVVFILAGGVVTWMISHQMIDDIRRSTFQQRKLRLKYLRHPLETS